MRAEMAGIQAREGPEKARRPPRVQLGLGRINRSGESERVGLDGQWTEPLRVLLRDWRRQV
jgi:hypothetical protein